MEKSFKNDGSPWQEGILDINIYISVENFIVLFHYIGMLKEMLFDSKHSSSPSVTFCHLTWHIQLSFLPGICNIFI